VKADGDHLDQWRPEATANPLRRRVLKGGRGRLEVEINRNRLPA